MSGLNNNNSADVPPPTPFINEIELNNIYYNCTECSSLIEILSINEENNMIQFKCLNKEQNHKEKIMPIKEFLEKMKNHKKVNKDICDIHKNNAYVSYCFDCNRHLCNECLMARTHINHIKNNILEIQPIKEELNIIEEIIKNYKVQIENLIMKKKARTKQLESSVNKIKKEEKKIIDEKIKNNKICQENELKLSEEKYVADVEEIKKKYQNELSMRKNEYKRDINGIFNKYKSINDGDYIRHKHKMEKIMKNYNEEINKMNYDIKIENLKNIKNLNEIVYNTYRNYNNNYYYSININNILLSYYKNENIKNNIIKKVLNNKFDIISKLILQKSKEDNNYKLKKEKEYTELKLEKEKIELQIIESKKDFENKLGQYKKEYLNNLRQFQEEQKKKEKEHENKIKHLREKYDKDIKSLREENDKLNKKYEEYKRMHDKLRDQNNEILIIYKINKNEDKIKIFGADFVKNNKSLCKIIYEGKEYELQEEFNVHNINKKKEILEIKLLDVLWL